MTKTINEMFEEYADNYSKIYALLFSNEDSTLIRRFRDENKQIIQLITKQIQSGLLKEVLQEVEDVWNNDADRKSAWWKGFTFALESSEKNIKKLAEKKGIIIN